MVRVLLTNVVYFIHFHVHKRAALTCMRESCQIPNVLFFFLLRHLSSQCLRAVGRVHIPPQYPPVSPWTQEHYHRRGIDHISQEKCTSENCRVKTKSYSLNDADWKESVKKKRIFCGYNKWNRKTEIFEVFEIRVNWGGGWARNWQCSRIYSNLNTQSI